MDQRAAGRLLCDFLSGRTMPDASLKQLSPADWESLIDRAQRFKVAGLLYRRLQSPDLPSDLVPVDARHRLRDAYREVATINTSLFCDASRVLRAFADHHLPVIALKGLSLAQHVYRDIALRPMADLDLLVKEEDLLTAGRILLTVGYRQDCPAWESMLKASHHLPPFRNRSGATIEVHWNLVAPESSIEVDLDGLWKRACLITVDNVGAWALSREDLLLHLCIHACGHLESGLDLIPLCDVAGVIRGSPDEIDWQVVIERARHWRGQKCVYLMLLLVRELLGAAPPDVVLAEAEPADYQPAFLDEALGQILEGSPSGQAIGARLGQFARIKSVQGIKGKVVALLTGAFPSRENLARKYSVSVSSPTIYLYYLLHLSRLTAYYAVALFRLLRRERSVMEAVDRAHRVSAVSDWMFSR